MQATMRPAGRFGVAKRSNTVVARRTVLGRPGAASGKPNIVLDEPDRLWEIGSRYWFPFANYSPPAYLDGTLPGDRGFDPLRLGESWGAPPGVEDASSEARLRWLLEAELYHGRLTMLAVVGVLVVDLQNKGPWWTAPYAYDWPLVGGSAPLTFTLGVVAFHTIIALLEKTRIENFAEKGEAGHLGAAPFDPLSLVDDYKRQAEIRNGRLAMLSFLGFAVQAWVTGLGPLECAKAHLADPFGANVFTYGDKGIQVVGWFLAASVLVHLAEANNGRRK